MNKMWWIILAVIAGIAIAVTFRVRRRVWQWLQLELVGYGVWLFAGAVFAVPEV
jgi:hypothetical protein